MFSGILFERVYTSGSQKTLGGQSKCTTSAHMEHLPWDYHPARPPSDDSRLGVSMPFGTP